MDCKITSILSQNQALQLLADGRKVKCTITGHEMPCRLDVLESYIRSKTYKRLSSLQKSEVYSKYKMHIVPSNKDEFKHQLFCTLTLRHLNNDRNQIENHLKGRRFQKAYARWQHCQETGEKFDARVRQKRKAVNEDEANDDGEWEDVDEDGSDVDSLSDLYPAADFERLHLKDDSSDYDFDSTADNTTDAASNKRNSADTTKLKRTSARNANKRRIGQKKPKTLKSDIKAKRPRNSD